MTFTPAFHVTDVAFGAGEWTGPNTVKQFFPVAGRTGSAYLYVEQASPPRATLGFSPQAASLESPDTLYLMHDHVNSNALGFTKASSFFDGFFQIPSDNSDYPVRIMPSGKDSFLAFERPHGSTPPTDAEGTFVIGAGSGWKVLTAADLALAQFHTAVGQGTSPDSATSHLMAEFELSIDNNGPTDTGDSTGRIGGNGLYDPAPAFWSASVAGFKDPPISSGIFSLSPTGTTSVTPVFGPNGGPVSIPIASVPEPSTLLLVVGALGVVGWSARRRRAAENRA